MKTLKHFTVMLLYVLLCAPLAQAQPAPDKQQEAQAANTIAQDVLVVIQPEKVRFTAQKAVTEMQLQVFDQAGQLVYDSGAVSETEMSWALRQSNGETVKSGLYAYKLSVKEAGASEARVLRGHFIVDRAGERDGKTDRLWITSQNDSGVGTELTVARNEGATIAGTSVTSERNIARTAEGAARDDEGGWKIDTTAALAAAISGNIGRIAKFTSATDLGNSVITELNGNIGILTTNPQGRLDVGGNIVLNGNVNTQLNASGEVTFLHGGVVVAKGRYIELDASPNGSGRLFIGGNPNDNNVFLFGFSADRTRSASAMWFAGKDGGKLPLIQMSADNTFIDGPLSVAGQTRTQTLQITGGADFAENFDVNETTGSEEMTPKVEAGMVVSIDPSSPGKLTLSAQAYDRRVAGVVSGAGGVKPGMVMKQEGTLADGKHPVALSGRVYCWVDASQGAIEPGDLLTTSSTPGHAMKATDSAKAQGAIIGKAMTSLKEGKGLALVLVTLQ